MNTGPLKPKWIVVRGAGGHYEALGSLIQSFEVKQNALERAHELMTQHHGTTYAVCMLVAEYRYEPQMIIREVPGVI